jgi:Glycosyl hydrolase family 26
VRLEPDVSPSHRAAADGSPVNRRAILAGGAAVAVTALGAGVVRLLTAGSPAPTASPRASAAGSAPAASSAPASRPPAPPVPAVKLGGGPVPGVRTKAMLGAYLQLSGMNFADAVALRRKQLGRNYKIVHVFYAWTDNLPAKIDDLPPGAIPMVSWRGTYHDDILGGKFDSMIAANARRLARDGKPKLLRWGWEMNGSWYAWSGSQNGDDPAGYVACWKYLRKIFADEGADNVAWVWSVNWNSKPDTPENDYQAYYPGDKFVDWVAISGYNLHHETPAKLFDRFYQQYASRKPVMISEVGSVDYGGRTKAEWVGQFAAYVNSRPDIAAVCWFDTDTHENYSETWRVDTDAHALAAFRSMARSARFSG